MSGQTITTLADTANVLYSPPNIGMEGDSQVFVRNKERYTIPWKVYFDKDKKNLAYQSTLNGDTCTTFDFWRTNGKLKKKTKFVKDTSWVNPIYGPVFHWYYEERYCVNGQQTYKGYPNNSSSQKVILYHCNGKKKLEYTLNADNIAPEGVFMMWYENGKKQEERYYKNGIPEGVWTYWKIDGSIYKKEKYIDGEQVETK